MIYQAKRDEIRRMLKFLEYGEHEHLLMQEITLGDGTWPSCNSKGEFYSNIYMSRRPLMVPSEKLISYAHGMLSRECKLKFSSLSVKHSFPFLPHLLRKFHNLDFVIKC